MSHPLWPLFDLRMFTPRLELRVPVDDDLVRLLAVARAGIHDPSEMPFAHPWTDLPSPEFERSFVQYQWSRRGDWRPDRWNLGLGVFLKGEPGGTADPIGMQNMFAADFATLRSVSSGSWLGREHQGRGIGTEMRGAMLALAFDGLGAWVALSEAFTDNVASIGVSRRLGYEENGRGLIARRGEPAETLRFRLTRERWASRPRPKIRIQGLEACLELFGIAPTG